MNSFELEIELGGDWSADEGEIHINKDQLAYAVVDYDDKLWECFVRGVTSGTWSRESLCGMITSVRLPVLCIFVCYCCCCSDDSP